MDIAKQEKGEGNKMWGYLFVFLIAIFFMKTLDKKLDQKSDADNQKGQKLTEYKGHYQAKYLLTKNEQAQYKKLKQYADANGLLICPKVRLLDIVEPRSGEPKYMAYMGKIKSKHVDFVICDQDLYIKGILELDDSSHDRADRQERDKFVDEILSDVGYTVIHTRYITENTLDPILKKKKVEGYVRIERNGPTFEEWKAEKLRQEQEKNIVNENR